MKGIITDATTGETLIGANVTIKGTSLGSPTDAYGKYMINAIPSGSYTLKISYLGYRSKETTVEVKGGSILELNFSLSGEALEGEEVVVTAQARGQHDAINQQLSSNTIMNVVSSDKIRELPDASAAAALSRLPGVSIVNSSANGAQIVIRGIEPKNNIILVNGIKLPSTDINTRSVNLGFISSNMLSSIEVTKTLTPDMDANSIGGVVNLRLMEAPKDFHVDVFAQGNYNHQDRTTDNYKFWASVSDRFLDNKLGVFIQGNAERSNAGNDQTTATYALADYPDPGYGEGSYRMNSFRFEDQANIISNYGGSLILDYALPHGKIVLQNTLARTTNDLTSYDYLMNFTLTNGLTYTLNRDKNNKALVINAFQTEYTFGTIKAEFTFSHSYSDKSTDIRYGDPGDNFGFVNTTVTPAHPYGFNASGSPIVISPHQREIFTPDDVYNLRVDPTDFAHAQLDGWATTRVEAFKEHLYNSNLDFTIPVSFSEDLSAKFKVGGKFSRSTRSNDLEEQYSRTGADLFYAAVQNFLPGKTLSTTNNLLMFPDVQDNKYYDARGKYFLNGTYPMQYVIDKDVMDRFLPLAATAWIPNRHFTNSERYDFSGAEIFSAGYAMGNFSIGSRLTVLAGVRFEHYNMKYNANNVLVTHSVDGLGKLFDTLNTSDNNNDNVLPNVQLRYKFTDWADIRLAYTQTLARPDYNALMPNVYYDPGLTAQSGNPNLKPTRAKNYDMSFSFYTNEIGLFTIGGFYKKLDDVFYQAFFYYKNLNLFNAAFPDTSFWMFQGVQPPNQGQLVQSYVNNPNPGYLKGIELEWQTNFWYLPRPFNTLVLNINYTRTWSEMDYVQVRNTAVPYQVGRFTYFDYVTTDTVYKSRLLDQSDHVLNVALGVDYKGFSGRVSFNLTSNIQTSVGNTTSTRPEADQFTGTIYRWDLTMQQKLPLEGLSVSFDVQNLSHSPVDTYQKFRRNPDGPIGDNQVGTSYAPSFYQLTLRYSI
jgi:TonB-dependent receptor